MKFWTLTARPSAVTTVLIAALALPGCSDSSPAEDGRVVAYQNCPSIRPDKGEPALYASLGVRKPVKSEFFEKRYNRAALEAVLKASGEETQNYSLRSGIPTYKIPAANADKLCRFHYALPTAPPEFIQNFNNVTTKSGGTLVGLFSVYSDGTKSIMVREEADRWTLVHEMMHENFHEQRQADGTPDRASLAPKIKRTMESVQAALSSYRTNKNPAAFDDATDLAVKLAQLQYQSLAAGSLEEIADESVLLKEYGAGRLRYVSEDAAANAAWYIRASGNLALQDLNGLKDTIEMMKKMAEDDLLASDAAKLQGILDFIKSTNDRVAELADQADRATKSAQVSALFFSSLVFEAPSRLAHVQHMSDSPDMIEFRKGLKQLNQLLQ